MDKWNWQYFKETLKTTRMNRRESMNKEKHINEINIQIKFRKENLTIFVKSGETESYL